MDCLKGEEIILYSDLKLPEFLFLFGVFVYGLECFLLPSILTVTVKS